MGVVLGRLLQSMLYYVRWPVEIVFSVEFYNFCGIEEKIQMYCLFPKSNTKKMHDDDDFGSAFDDCFESIGM